MKSQRVAQKPEINKAGEAPIRAMERVRLCSSGLDGSNDDALRAYLEQCNAFRDEQEYILKF